MGLLDKVKVQASQAAQRAQQVGKAGQARIVDVQAKRRIEALFRDLGAAIYAERTGKPGGGAGLIDGLVQRIRALEAEHGSEAVETEPTADREPPETGGGQDDEP